MGAPPGQAMPPQALVQPATSGIGTPKRPSARADNGRRSAASRFAESADDGRGTILIREIAFCASSYIVADISRAEARRAGSGRRPGCFRCSRRRVSSADLSPVPISRPRTAARRAGSERRLFLRFPGGCVAWYIAAKEIRYHLEAPAAKRDGQRHRAFPRKRSSPSTVAEPPLGSIYSEMPF